MHRASALKNTGRSVLILSSALILSGLGIYARSVTSPGLEGQVQIYYNAQEESFQLTQQPGNKNTQPEAITSEAGSSAAVAEPKVGPQHPQLNLDVTVDQKKMEMQAAVPSADDAQAPKKFHATAYSLHGITASGAHTRRGVIAADPKVLPLGSVVQLKVGEKYSGVYTVRDTGRLIKGKRIDIWMPSYNEARRFGRQPIKLVVLKYGARGRRK